MINKNQFTIFKQCQRTFNWHLKDQERKGNVMSVSFTAYAILGVEVDIKKLTSTQMVRGCDCELTVIQLQDKFCPKCRAAIQEEQDVPIEGYVPEETLFGMDIIFSIDLEKAYVGQIKHDEETGIVDCFYPIFRNDTIFQLKEQLREKLGDLYDSEKFGMYAVIHCSY